MIAIFCHLCLEYAITVQWLLVLNMPLRSSVCYILSFTSCIYHYGPVVAIFCHLYPENTIMGQWLMYFDVIVWPEIRYTHVNSFPHFLLELVCRVLPRPDEYPSTPCVQYVTVLQWHE